MAAWQKRWLADLLLLAVAILAVAKVVVAVVWSVLNFGHELTAPWLFVSDSPTGRGQVTILTLGFQDRGWNFYVRDARAHENELVLVAAHWPYNDWGRIGQVVWSQDGSVVAISWEGNDFQWAYDFDAHTRLCLVPKAFNEIAPEISEQNRKRIGDLISQRGGIGVVAFQASEPTSNVGRKVGIGEWRRLRWEYSAARSRSIDWDGETTSTLTNKPQ